MTRSVSPPRRPRRFVDPWLYVMLAPSLILILVYAYGPLFGLSIAFKEYDIARGVMGSPWAGLAKFRYLFKNPNFKRVITNTVSLSVMKLAFRFIVPVTVAILLNEVRSVPFKRAVQTLAYLPYFVSWVALSGVFISILSPTDGAVNEIIKAMGMKPIYFLGDPDIFPGVMVVTDVWKEFGYGTIVYMAALTSIDPSLYEAAAIDGAGRARRVRHITLPGMTSILVLMFILSLGGLMNAGFDQVFNLYNPMVYRTGDILDTFTYRIGMVNAQYDTATAVGLIKSGVSLALVSGSYYAAYKFADYRIF
ncbi:MAG: ABC transporter permease subunit [Oscillospiraceae bacterium]|nr:ABC transporter permease subunit [Oscillospiraceae bacterium]